MPTRAPTHPPSPETPRFTVGSRIYAAFRSLGQHGVGERLLARPVDAGEPGSLVLIQRLRATSSEGDRQRLFEEARLLRLLNHPCIPRVLAVAPGAQRPWVALEYVEGMSLERVLNRAVVSRQPMSAPFAASVVAQVAEVLHAAHGLKDERGQLLHFVHRDVCPRHISLTRDGGVQLTAFGAAFTTRQGRPATLGLLVKGTGEYAAPEVLLHRVPDARADIFSLGLILLELLSNRYLLDPSDEGAPRVLPGHLAKLAKRLRAEDPGWAPPARLAARVEHLRPEDVERVAANAPAALRAVVLRALRLQPEERYASALALRDELHGFLAQQAQPYGKEERLAELRRRISTRGYRREGVETSQEPVPAEFRRPRAGMEG